MLRWFVFALTAIVPALVSAQDTLKVKEQKLDEVVVNANSAKRRIGSLQPGAEQLQVKELTATPALFGERDLMRSVQLLPGVKAESDASSGFQVRGGTSAQNIILYDNTPVYNVSHLGGLFSAFNDDALSTATLFKGVIPAQYGDASAAVFDITGRSGHRQAWHGGASVGILSAKAAIEGPVVKDRCSLLFTARRSYMDLFLKQFDDFRGNSLYFYDVNAKVDYRLSDRDQLFASFFASNDKTALKDMVDLGWRNMAASLSWLHHYRGNSRAQTTLYSSNYTTDNGINVLGFDVSFAGHIRQHGLRQQFHLELGHGSEIEAGAQTALLDVVTAEWQKVNTRERERRKAWENNVWANVVIPIIYIKEGEPRLTLSGGVRVSSFSSLGGPYYYDIDDSGNIAWLYKTRKNHIINTHWTVEPRLSAIFQMTNLTSLKAGYSRTAQNIHALRNQSTSTPFDRYTLSSNLVRPETADQLSLGLYTMTADQQFDVSAEGYYRHANHVLDYRDGISFSSEIEIERLVKAGEGQGYGIELCARKNSGRLTGWVAYTLSWSKTRIDGINGGRWYTASNDRRHDVDIVGTYRLSPAWTLSGVWVYNSGQAFTAPSGKYEIIDNYIYYYAERNGYRAPAYHRLDVSATWAKRLKGGKVTREWTFGVYNLYNHYNPFLIDFEDSNNGARTKAVQYSLFGIVPSVSVSFKF